ncbi:unnamed protein product [Wuchereria bancrofti]|uniref:Uncharacterized protein n=1 Tax=Wuchereria bancrofti TaxID=6293 RepID=A0A3P7EIQ2_WUCBA|nr:unnamed protein product [Wuchereria bancrofti]
MIISYLHHVYKIFELVMIIQQMQFTFNGHIQMKYKMMFNHNFWFVIELLIVLMVLPNLIGNIH